VSEGSKISEPDRWLAPKPQSAHAPATCFSGELAAIELLVAQAHRSGMKPAMIELPPTNTLRWVARRKAAVVSAVSSGMLTIEEACRRYHMSEDELLAWQHAFERSGIDGLRSGSVQPIPKRHTSRDRPTFRKDR